MQLGLSSSTCLSIDEAVARYDALLLAGADILKISHDGQEVTVAELRAQMELVDVRPWIPVRRL